MLQVSFLKYFVSIDPSCHLLGRQGYIYKYNTWLDDGVWVVVIWVGSICLRLRAGLMRGAKVALVKRFQSFNHNWSGS